MTIKYALTRTEMVRSFLTSLGRSPKFLLMILIYSVGLGWFSLAMRVALSRPLTGRDIVFVAGRCLYDNWPS